MQKITVGENVGGKWSVKKMEEEDGLRTVECLRGRLLAERVASRNAKVEAEQMADKLNELEAELKQEIKARKRAEKKLKLMMKKLESLNLSYVSEEKSEVTFVSSTAFSATNEAEDKKPNAQSVNGSKKSQIQDSIAFNQSTAKFSKGNVSPADDETLSSASEAGLGELMTPRCRSEESSETANSSTASNNFQQNILQITKSSEGHDCPAMEETYNYSGDAQSERSSELDYGGYDHILKASVKDEEVNVDTSQGHDHSVDNAMALVPVDLPKTEQTIDPDVLDATVKEVLDSLKHAKEKLRISMEQGRMIKVG